MRFPSLAGRAKGGRGLRTILRRAASTKITTFAGEIVAKMLHLSEELQSLMMGRALAEAECAAEQGEVPIGAVVAFGARLIAKGHNLTETLSDPTAHAEMIAISAALSTLGGKYLHQCQLYVTVEPCAMCAGAIAWVRLDALVYGAAEPKFGFSRFQPSLLHRRTAVVAGVREKECAALMRKFFSTKRG